MTAIDKAALIEQAAKALYEMAEPESFHYPWEAEDKSMKAYWRMEAGAALPVIAKALLAPLRELHVSITISSYPGSGESWDECAECCGQIHPCLTVRLLDAIEAEVQP